MNGNEIPLSRPDISESEVEHVVRVLRSGRLSIGPMVETFEAQVAELVGVRHAVAVSSGTAGLHLALLSLGIGEGDEVITTPFSFVASSNSLLFVGAKPVFVDIDPVTLNMDPRQVEAAITPRTKGILAVEAFGNPAHMDAYAQIAAKHELPLIEDCCEALGTAMHGRRAGQFGRVGVFGFYPNKQITTGEGGMIVTDDEHVADMCRSMRNQGRPVSKNQPSPLAVSWNAGSWLYHERLGYNYRMSEISAAIGVAQMNRFESMMARRRNVAQGYLRRLIGNTHIVTPNVPAGATLSWFVFVVRLAAGYDAEERNRIITGMRRHDIGSADYFPCIHLMPFYRKIFGYEEGMFPIAESVSRRTIALPFYNSLSEREVDLIVQTLDVMIGREQLLRS